MKALVTSITLFLVIHIAGKAQDLSGLFPFAHYTLINTQDDALGLQNPMVFTNTVYEGNDGIYFNGKHPLVDQGGSSARTTYMSAMFDPKFAVQVEFKIEDLDDEYRCIIVCGLSTLHEYLGLFIHSTDKLMILLSDMVFIELPDINPQENVWYKFTMIYDTVSNNAKFYLGNNLIESANHQLVRIPNDAFVNNLYLPAGYPLEGNWRNLRIYGSEEVTSLEEELDQATDLFVFPNPATNELHFECRLLQASHWRITAMNGESFTEGKIVAQDNIVSLEGFPAGAYNLQVLDENNNLLSTRQFSKL